MLEFMPKEITETAESWDLPDGHESWKVGDELFSYAALAVRSVKELLSLFENKSVSFAAISQYLEKYYSNVDDLYHATSDIDLLKENKSCLTDVEINKILRAVAKITLDTIERDLKELYIKNDALTKLRNEHLTSKVKEVVFDSGKSAIFLAGLDHPKDPYVISYVKKLNKMSGIPYLFLIAKPFVTFDSIQKSYDELFMNAKVEGYKAATSAVVENNTTEPISEEVYFNDLKALLLNFDVDKIDLDLNHFGEWLHISIEILIRLALPIAPKVDS